MKVIAFMQNIWLKPASVPRYEPMLAGPQREEIIRRLLFYSCRTGKRLTAAGFDPELVCWEESTRKIGTKSGAVFPPDPDHMVEVIDRHRPSLILTFGIVAAGGLELARPKLKGHGHHIDIVAGPHPSARGAHVAPKLAQMAAATKLHLEKP